MQEERTTNASAMLGGLVQQGYKGCSLEELQALTWPLRFTPGVCMLGCIAGLALQSPPIHYGLAILGMSALFLPAHHPVDLLYNQIVRPLVGGATLPPNPLPRRIACFLGGLMNLAAGLCFAANLPLVAYAVGLALIVLQLIVISSHFCLASWIMEIGSLIFGFGRERIGGAQARQLVEEERARLIDVRTPAEYAARHLPGAVNVPLSELKQRIDELRAMESPLVLYCASGMRSARARGLLERAGLAPVHDLGGIARWGQAE
jgi:rhodanese-related sulfurtransferase